MCEQPVHSYVSGKFTVKIYDDFDPDLSYLGEFTDHPNWNTSQRFKIYDRKMTGHYTHNSYQYFQSAYDVVDAQNWYHEHGYSKHDSYTIPLLQDKQNHERFESYGNLWNMIGICITYEGLTLASCWGIESDSDYSDIIADLLLEAEFEYLKIHPTNDNKKRYVGYKHHKKE